MLAADMEVDYVHALRQLSAEYSDTCLQKWSLFAGTGMSARMMDDLTTFWEVRYNVKLVTSTYLFAESDPKKLQFLKCQHPTAELFCSNVSNLKTTVMKEAGDPSGTLLRQPGFIDMGIPCVSRSTLSAHCAKNLNCVQEEREATGVAFREAKRVCFHHNPPVVVAECVLGLRASAHRADGKPMLSDAEWVCEEFRKKGWWAFHAAMSASDYGAWCRRERCWWAFLSDVEGDPRVIQAWSTKLLHQFKTKDKPGTMFTAHDFLVFDSSERKQRACDLGMPLLKDFGQKVSRVKQEERGWEMDHLTWFGSNSLKWPWSKLTHQSRSHIEYDPFLLRECEAVFFLDTLFPPQSDIELLDINPQLQWLVGDYADESNKVDLSKGTPWHAQCYTQVASGKLVLRQKLEGRDLDMYAPKTWLVRIVEPFEAMNILGWCDIKHWLPPSTDHVWTAQALEVLFNLAGNACSMFHFVPWVCAALATWGKFRKRHSHIERPLAFADDSHEGGCDSFSDPDTE